MAQKTFLFDLDGTLINSFEGYYAIDNEIFKQLGNTSVTKKEYKSFFHKPFVETYAHFLPHVEINKILKIYSQIEKKYLHLIKPYDGVIEILEKIIRFGHTTAVISNQTKNNIKETLTQHNLTTYFSVSVGSDEVTNPKPHKDHVLSTLEKLNMKPNKNIYMIGDSNADISSGHDAGVTTILVHENNTTELAYKPNYILKNIKDLERFI